MTSKAGVADGRWSTGAAFGDYDGDGYADLMVTNYVDFKLGDPPASAVVLPASTAASMFSADLAA